MNIRFAQKSDVKSILSFIQALAEYEKLSHEVIASEPLLCDSLFSDNPDAEVIILEVEDSDETEPKAVGFALFFHNYSTFLAQKGIYLEDLFVLPEYRGKGYGKALLTQLARIAKERDCGRLEWSVLDWNTPAIEFYQSLGAEFMNGWTVNRLTGKTLNNLAND